MFYLTCNMMPSVELARYGVSRAKDLGVWEMCYKNFCEKKYFKIKVPNQKDSI